MRVGYERAIGGFMYIGIYSMQGFEKTNFPESISASKSLEKVVLSMKELSKLIPYSRGFFPYRNPTVSRDFQKG